MAGHVSDYTRGEMEVDAHKSTFHAFILMTKWGSLSVATALLFLVTWFCTGAGFLAAGVSAVVLALLGALLLRDKPAAATH
jgi:hypothetical protein